MFHSSSLTRCAYPMLVMVLCTSFTVSQAAEHRLTNAPPPNQPTQAFAEQTWLQSVQQWLADRIVPVSSGNPADKPGTNKAADCSLLSDKNKSCTAAAADCTAPCTPKEGSCSGSDSTNGIHPDKGPNCSIKACVDCSWCWLGSTSGATLTATDNWCPICTWQQSLTAAKTETGSTQLCSP